MQSNVSGHWTDQQLIASLYGVGPEDDHLGACSPCQIRLTELRTHREGLERMQPDEPGTTILATQRRQIYARIAQPVRWWSGTHMRRWASAFATLLVLGGGLMVFEAHHERQLINPQISDAQLADQVSGMIQTSEPQSTAPLQELFDE